MSQDNRTPEQQAKDALASLNKSANVRPSVKLSDTQKRDMDLRELDIYQIPKAHREDSTSTESSPASASLMSKLWMLMTDLYGHKWTSVHGLEDESGVWGKALAGITPEQIAAGAKACTTSGNAWPPSAPEFRAMCQPNPASLGLPDTTSAFLEAMRQSHSPDTYIFSHEAVRLAGIAVGWYDLQRCIPSEESLRKRFDSAYGALVGKIQRGEDLTAPLQAIESDRDKDPAVLANEEAEHRLNDRIREQGLGDKTPEQLRAEMLAKFRIKREPK